MPVTSPEQFGQYLSAPEGTRLEFKSARTSYEFDKLVNYCVALANEGGGTMILGVTDKRPRDVVGTTAFPEPGETEASLHRVFNHRIPIEEYFHEGKRVLPAQSRASILRMLQDLRDEGRVELSGAGRSTRWQLRQNPDVDAITDAQTLT